MSHGCFEVFCHSLRWIHFGALSGSLVMTVNRGLQHCLPLHVLFPAPDGLGHHVMPLSDEQMSVAVLHCVVNQLANYLTPSSYFFVAGIKEYIWHDEIATKLGGWDPEGAVRIAGARFSVLKGPVARMERALGQWLLDLHT